MTTYTAFIGSISGLVVSGVVKRLTAPPTVINDLPCSFPMLPSGSDEAIVFGGSVGGTNPTLTCDLIFAYEAVAQGTQAQNYNGLLALMDAIIAAVNVMTRPTKGATSYTIRLGTVTVGEVNYWAIIVGFTGVG